MKVIVHRTFGKQFAKVDAKIRRHFQARRDLFLDSPYHPLLYTHPLTGDRTGQWSFNVTGDWRVVFEFNDQSIVTFLEIGTHDSLFNK
ncbi:MAG TPA: type II toxin-antitoxin system YafQ family toxin [Candidatus Paceibacterota bacterium]